MAVIRNTSSQRRVGRVGADTYYVANGQQIVRQAQNNSNYGVSASRTESQQQRRVRWANLVNFYKTCKFWMPACFESKSLGQSDYNKFMSVNLANANICLTKDMASSGCTVIDHLQVSQGSLTPISLTMSSSFIVSNLFVADYQKITTIGELARQVIASNPGWEDGDGISLLAFIGRSPRNGYPYVSTYYDEVVLDTRDVNALNTRENLFEITIDNDCFAVNGYPEADDSNGDWSVVMLHTRKAYKTLVSSQYLEIGNMSLSQIYAAPTWEQECIKSYGLTDEYVVTPNAIIAVLRRWRLGDGDWNIFRGALSVTVVASVNVVFDVENGTSLSFYVELNGEKKELTRDGKFYVLDTTESGIYTVYVNGESVGKITSNEA